MLACGLRRQLRKLPELVPPPPAPVTLLILSELLDPENLGASLRAAAAFGVDAVVVGPHCPDPFSRRVIRVSMGAVWKVPLTLSDNLSPDVDWLQQQAGVDVVATVLDPQADPLARASRSRRMAILLGSEGCGLPVELIGRCHRRVTIPMQLATDSLNVSMAAGIFLYHFTQAEA
jgi:tRNA G18 (ribose-2'-O)-methylase SpoU